MAFPAFFDAAPRIRLRDGLAQLLGASDDGMIEYSYADAVRLAGHSCPTVAGSWLMARAALKALYGEDVPARGEVSVFMDDAEDAGVTGVMAQVYTLVTGAAAANGFHGLAGKHVRSGLLRYAATGVNGARFARNDTGAAVEVQLDASVVPPEPQQRLLIPLVINDMASPDQAREFGRLWQERVRRMLLEHADDARMIRVRPV